MRYDLLIIRAEKLEESKKTTHLFTRPNDLF